MGHSGGGTDLLHAMDHAFRLSEKLDAIYLVSDGKQDINDQFIQRIEQLYASHPNRPKVITITLNCVPRRRGWNYMQRLSLLSHGVFRPVCLEQDIAAFYQLNPEPEVGAKTSVEDAGFEG